jgi:hypothetical protein
MTKKTAAPQAPTAAADAEIAWLQKLLDAVRKLQAVQAAVQGVKRDAPVRQQAIRDGMPASFVDDLAGAVPDKLAAELRADALKPNPVTQCGSSQLSQDRGGAQVVRGTGYRDAVPLGPPPGVPIMDRLLDMQDRIDKADLKRRLGATAKEKG